MSYIQFHFFTEEHQKKRRPRNKFDKYQTLPQEKSELNETRRLAYYARENLKLSEPFFWLFHTVSGISVRNK